MKWIKIISGISALLFMVTACGDNKNSSQQGQPEKYPTILLNNQNIVLESVYPVTIKGKEDIEIRPRIDGFIKDIYVDEGAIVKKGQSLFKIDSPLAEQSLTSAKASVESAKAQVSTAKTNVERLEPLAEKGIISDVQLKTAKDAYQTALAVQAQAEAALKNARATVDWTNVSSPVDGLVGAIPFRQGSLVNSSNILTTVANTSNVFAYFSLNEKELSMFLDNLEGSTQAEKIKNIPEIAMTLADGTAYEHPGKIETITGSVNSATGSAGFRAVFPNEQGKLRSGMSGKISIPRSVENVIVVPQKATYSQQNKTLIYLVQCDSVIQRAISVIPTPDSKSYVVTEGLQTGDRIVTEGVATLSQGKKISIE